MLDISGARFINTRPPEEVIPWAEKMDEFSVLSTVQQLKKSFEDAKDKQYANFFRSKELAIHRRLLRWTYRQGPEKLTLFFNQSNDYGQNWLKPIILLLGIGGCLYSMFLYTFGYRFDLSSKGFSFFLTYYFDFLIPGYLYPTKTRFDFLSVLGGIMDLDFSSLKFHQKLIVFANDILVMPYLILQSITAFRKHSGKD